MPMNRAVHPLPHAPTAPERRSSALPRTGPCPVAAPGSRVAAGLCAALAGAALHLAPATLRAQPALSETLAWRCEVVYLPARSTWVRSLTLRVEGQRITELRIDAQPVHTFAVEGTLLLTSMDNERIAIDVAAGDWTSDFRGLATGRGRCEREPVSNRP